jgi:hypothetical protein
MKIKKALENILSPAYAPCQEFSATCNQMRWIPTVGHVPRGFAGACGKLAEVQLVLVFAEPGDPLPGQSHSGLTSAYDYTTSRFRTSTDLFHRNVLKVLEMCWPDLTFEQKMRLSPLGRGS